MLSFSYSRLLNSNTFTTVADDAFAGLSHLQYLWVSKNQLSSQNGKVLFRISDEIGDF